MANLTDGGFTDGSTTTAQRRIELNGISVYGPDKDMQYSFETTYSKSSQRSQKGVGFFTPLFTVEQYSYKATNIPVAEANKIFKIIAKGKKFTLRHYSLYHLEWRTDYFYVGKGQMNIGKLSSDQKYLSELSFNMQGVNPLD